MSYCVNCGVRLDDQAKVCPLCHTPVMHPGKQWKGEEKPFFASRKETVEPVSKKELALLLSAMFASVCICCGLLNIALRPEIWWSLYAVGAAIMLWIFFVPPLLWRKMPVLFKTFVNLCAVALYVLLIALASGGLNWYFQLALPILFTTTLLVLILCDLMRDGRRSTLTSIQLVLVAVGAECMAIDFFVDRFLKGVWSPGWSLVVLAVCVGLAVPFAVIRWVPSLREEVRRRFHL